MRFWTSSQSAGIWVSRTSAPLILTPAAFDVFATPSKCDPHLFVRSSCVQERHQQHPRHAPGAAVASIAPSGQASGEKPLLHSNLNTKHAETLL